MSSIWVVDYYQGRGYPLMYYFSDSVRAAAFYSQMIKETKEENHKYWGLYQTSVDEQNGTIL